MDASSIDGNILACAAEAYNNVLSLLEAQTRVSMALSTLLHQIDSHKLQARYSKVISSIESFQPKYEQVQHLVNNLQDIVEPTARPTEASGVVARRVFAIPELLEHILLHLEPAELLVAQQTNRSTNLAVRSSFRLQQRLQLRSTGSTYFSTIFHKDNFPGLCVDVRKTPANGIDWLWNEPVSAEDSTLARLTIRFDGNTSLPRAGKRCQSMLLCQPALRTVIVQPTCCFADYTVTPKPTLARFGHGVTVGDLFDAVEKVRKEHCNCALAEGPMHRTDGTVKVDVRVCQSLQLSPLDPLITSNRNSAQLRANRSSHRRSYSRQIEEQEKLLNDFAAAKRDALALSFRVPTLAEYQAALRHEQFLRSLEPGYSGGGDCGVSTTILV